MPLDGIAKQYAAMLYQKRLEEILESQKRELQNLAIAQRGHGLSGAALAAQANVIGTHAGLMAIARAQTLAQAYEKAGHSLDKSTLQELSAAINDFCTGYKPNLRSAANNLVSPQWGNHRATLVESLYGSMETEFLTAGAKATRDLTLKHHEKILDEEVAARKGYAAGMGKHWDVFISHASEDKDGFVRPLAEALTKSGLQVWFDETALTIGDSLRAKIDEGLSQSRFGIVVLSPHFFAKSWPRWELDGLVSREVSGIKVILPVWHEVDLESVRAYSPILAGRLGGKSSDGIDKLVGDLKAAMGL